MRDELVFPKKPNVKNPVIASLFHAGEQWREGRHDHPLADDETAVSHLARCVAPRGRLVFINPAHRRLYSVLDRVYGHHRRYERSDATRLARAADLEVEAVEHFNVAGVAGWWWNHRLLGDRGEAR